MGDATAKGGAAGGGAAVDAQAMKNRHRRRNEQPARILACGFVEAPALLPAATCDALLSLDRSAAVPISNARQLSVQGAELRLVERALERSPQLRRTVHAVFGTEEFIVPKDSLKVVGPGHARTRRAPRPVPPAEVRAPPPTPRAVAQILDVEPGTLPQIPHADDTCNRELFVVAHLRAGQARSPSQPTCAPRRHPPHAPRLPPPADRPRPSAWRTSSTPTTP